MRVGDESIGDESVRRSAVDGRSRMFLVGEAPPCRKPDRGDQGTLRGAQQSREWLGDCSGDAEEAVVYRIGLMEPRQGDHKAICLADDPNHPTDNTISLRNIKE